ncbi:O-antigen ligase family protein [Congregibacter variabilis]|uniref:O-antigen ligase family protein n=1 Tax=Congregibacter variabilis TaxID=3081200 RepID=A0ABZ0I633_9GAMM|nr:O-antigen ligase family protein [Congregibacter sp. IMCC43200]
MLAVLLLLLFMAPIPLGSKHPLGALFLTTASLVLTSIWIATSAITGALTHTMGRRERLIALAFSLFTAYVFLSSAPLSIESVRLLNPAAAAHYESVPDFDPASPVALSLDRGATLERALRSAAMTAVFVVLLCVLQSSRRIKLFAYGLAAAGIAHAAFALVDMQFSGAIFRQPIAEIALSTFSIAGTYTNRNHFAGLMELTLALTVSFYFLRSRYRRTGKGWRSIVRRVFTYFFSGSIWYLIATLPPLLALLFSASRGGALSALGALVISLGLVAYKKRGGAAPARMVTTGVLIIPLIGASILAIDSLLERVERNGLLDDSRYELRQLAYRVFSDYPVFGTGSGTFRHIYPAYETQPFSTGKMLHHVHNDYLELLLENGIIGFALFGGGILLWLVTMCDVRLNNNSRCSFAISIGCFAGVVALLIHSLVDWNLQIPANALWFTTFLALGLAARRDANTNKVQA